MALDTVSSYPAKRLCGLPQSPMTYVAQEFSGMLGGSERTGLFQSFRDLSLHNNKSALSRNGGLNYHEQKAEFISTMRGAADSGTYDLETWNNIASLSPRFLNESMGLVRRMTRTISHNTFANSIVDYLSHDYTYGSPRALLTEATNAIIGCSFSKDEEALIIPETAMDKFRGFAAHIENYLDYFEQIVSMGMAFFCPDEEMSSLPKITGPALPDLMESLSLAYSLRFLASNFRVVPSAMQQGPAAENTITISVEEGMQNMELPYILVASKLACDIKNFVRIVTTQEMSRICDPDNYWAQFRGTSLSYAIDGKQIEDPVALNIAAAPVNDKVWSLSISDNGTGIAVQDLFAPLIEACSFYPESIPPSIGSAVAQWVNGDFMAFNNVPYGDLLEAVYLLGVTTSSGARGSGLGLWGSAGMLLKLGAVIKVGVTPVSGGLCQQIFLPMDLSVTEHEVRQAADSYRSRN